MKAEKSMKRNTRNLSFFIGVFFSFSFAPPLGVGAQSTLVHDVPFMSQAPTFQWSDERFQNACEEASILMAFAWAGVQPLAPTRTSQAQKILELTAFEVERYGDHHDTSVDDTVRFAREYSGYDGLTVKRNIRWRDIVTALENGSLVIVPADGRVLKNPNFKGLGPQEHMLLVRGYDYATQEFITNDPGTRRGEGYRYHRKVLYTAIRDYKTGKHEKGRPRTKSMIVAEKID